MLTKDKLFEVMHNPWFLQVIDRHDLERVAKDHPYFNIIHVLIAKKAQLQNHTNLDSYLNKAAICAGHRETLYNLINNISPYTNQTIKPDDMLLIDYADKVAVTTAPNLPATENANGKPKEWLETNNDQDDIMLGMQTFNETVSELPDEDNEDSINLQDDVETISSLELENASQQHIEQEVKDEMQYLSLTQSETNHITLDEENTDAEDISIEEADIEISPLPMTELPPVMQQTEAESREVFTGHAMAFVEEHKDELADNTLTNEGLLITDDEGERTYFNLNEKHSFMEWLTYFKSQKESPKTATAQPMKTVSEVLKELEPALNRQQVENKNPAQAAPAEEKAPAINADALAKRSVEDSSQGLISETLAQVLLSQGQYDKAIVMYARLSLLNPEKSLYFADIIKDIKLKYNV